MPIGQLIRSPPFKVLVLTNFFCCATHSGPIIHTVSYAVTCGIPLTTAVTIYSVEGLAGLGGRIAFGLAGDRFGARRILIAGLLMQAFFAASYYFASSLSAFYAVAVLFGFTYGGVMPLYAVLARENFPLRIMPAAGRDGRVIVGQKHLLDRLLIALLTNGHVLLEGVPGLAKTLALKTLANCLAVRFKRLQFTPDMLPADIVGTMIYNPQDGAFRTKHGPIFSNLILADEINRAPAKVQSALLEAMQERQVTIGDETYPLPAPFLVLATQNPLEQEGTYPLPEAQIDRFMMKVIVDYPTRTEERAILDAMATTEPMIVPRAVVSAAQILAARHVVNMLFVDDKVRDYIVDIVLATRPPIAAGLDLNGYVQTAPRRGPPSRSRWGHAPWHFSMAGTSSRRRTSRRLRWMYCAIGCR
jgi:MoxR-like ATPase